VSLYLVLKALHVLAAITWVGGTVTTFLLATRLLGRGERARVIRFVGDIDWLGKVLLIPAAVAVLLLGIATAIVGRYSFLTPWILIGLGGVALTIMTSVAFFEPETRRILALGEAAGEQHAEVERRVRRAMAVTRVDLAIMVVVVLDMVLKPGS
jgi:uncharacterized membrane protein